MRQSRHGQTHTDDSQNGNTGFQEKLTHNSTLKFYRFAIVQKLTLYKPLRQARTPAKRKLTSFLDHNCRLANPPAALLSLTLPPHIPIPTATIVLSCKVSP
jgi:hypothetical protein